MSDNPTVQRAASILRKNGAASWMSEDLAEALAAAGLLADPTSPTVTDEQAAVIEAVRSLLNGVPERAGSGDTTRVPWDRVRQLMAALWRYDESVGRAARRAAVDRLTATDQEGQ